MDFRVRATVALFLAASLFLSVGPSDIAADDAQRPITAMLTAQVAAAACSVGIDELNHALLPATREQSLPDGYEPPDLAFAAEAGIPQQGWQQLRALIIPDTLALVEAARADGLRLVVSSGYRSSAAQASTYRYWVGVRGQEAADRVSARPGHSQHQLGTAIDFNFGALGGFATSPAGLWLWDHAHEYGFVFPYTVASVAQSGYIFEPWHVRWVGRELAQLMRDQDYQSSDTVSADDYVAAAREALPAVPSSGVASCGGTGGQV